MKVVINAISIAKGGGMAVLLNLLEIMAPLDPDIMWYIAAEKAVIQRLPKKDNIIGVSYDWVRKTPLHHLYWYEFELPKLLKKIKANLCFSLTNFMPMRQLPCPSLLLVHHAGYFSEKFKQLHYVWFGSVKNRFLWNKRTKWVRQSVIKATHVTVQTHALANKIVQQINLSSDKVSVIPHGSGLIKFPYTKARELDLEKPLRIGYITKMGVQKDFITAIKAVSLLKNRGLNIKLILTMDEYDPTFYPMLSYVRQLIDQHHVSDVVEQYGELRNPDEIAQLFASLDVYIFPSLCESFGFTLLEAMASALPVIAADTDSNREIIAEEICLFAAENAENMADKILEVISDKNVYSSLSLHSLQRIKAFNWEITGKKMLNTVKTIAAQGVQ